MLAEEARQRMSFRVEPGTAEFRGLEVDSERAFLHVGVGKRMRTYHEMTRSVAFESEEYANVDSWKTFRYDGRQGLVVCLGIDGSTHRIYLSEDAGLTGTEVLSVTTLSDVIEAHSEPRILTYLYENGAGVFNRESEDGGVTWSDAEAVQYDGSQLDGTLRDCTNDGRANSILHLSIEIAGDTVVLYSEDYGKTFTLELS